MQSRRPTRTLAVAIVLMLTGAVAAPALTGAKGLDVAPTAMAPTPPAYVGSAVCARCHRDEAKLWNGSHHQLAMDHATDKSVLYRDSLRSRI